MFEREREKYCTLWLSRRLRVILSDLISEGDPAADKMAYMGAPSCLQLGTLVISGYQERPQENALPVLVYIFMQTCADLHQLCLSHTHPHIGTTMAKENTVPIHIRYHHLVSFTFNYVLYPTV